MNPNEFCFECPACGQRISATRDAVGASANCPVCSASFIVPLLQPANSDAPRVSKPARETFREEVAVKVPNGGSAHDKQPLVKVRHFIDAILKVLECFLTPRSVLCIAGLVLIASWAYPPGYQSRSSRGWFFLFDTGSTMRVDFERLILLDAIIVALGAWLAFLLRSARARTAAARIAFYSLIAVSVLAGGWRLVTHIGYMRWQADRQRVLQARVQRRANDAAEKAKALARVKALESRFDPITNPTKILQGIRQAREAQYSDQEIYSFLTERFDFRIQESINGLPDLEKLLLDEEGKASKKSKD